LKGIAPPRNKSALGSWASAYVSKAEKMGLDIFSASLDVHTPATRGEVISIILEILEIPTNIQIPSQYTDLPENHIHAKSIITATAYGLVSGDTDSAGNQLGTFRPDEQINRAEVAKIISIAQKAWSQ